jgi:hypothetical protein
MHMSKRIKFLKIQLATAVFALIVALVSGFFIFGPELTQFAKALTGDYSPAKTGVTSADWQNLDNDFVARSGGAASSMTGILDMGNQRITNVAAPTADTDAVNRGAMNTAITSALTGSSDIKDTSGNNFKMVCGSTPTGATAWQLYGPDPHSIYVDVTIPAGFSSTPHYFSFLRGSMSYVTVGTDQIYAPTTAGFTLHVVYLGVNNNYLTPSSVFITPAQANTWQWTIYWCAIGS